MEVQQLDLAKQFLSHHTPDGRLLMCAVTGSHIYGFAAPDSDIDMKGIHMAPTPSMLGLGRPVDVHNRLMMYEGVECDLTTHEVGKALSLVLRGNGNMLERLFSPIQMVKTEQLSELQELARASFSRSCFSHYSGFFKGMQRAHLREAPMMKSMLSSVRVALTGIHLLKTAEVVSDLWVLTGLYGFREVEDLMDRKSTAMDKAALTEMESKRYQKLWPILGELLLESRDQSPLPPHPPNEAACSEWLTSLRIQGLSEGSTA